MRVTVVGPAYPLRGGIAHHVYWLQQELSSRGHQIQTVSFRRLYPQLFFPGTTPTDVSRMKLDPGADPILDSLNPITWYSAYKKVKQFSPDVILLQWWHPFFSPLMGILGRGFRNAGFRCLMECHNIFPHERSVLDEPLLRFALSPIQRFITHSSRDQQDLLTLFPGRSVEVVPLPVLKEFLHPVSHNSGPQTILFFGIVRPYKGLAVLLRAMPKILSKIDCQLVIAGEFYEPVEKYRRLMREYGIEDHVQVDNRYIPNEEVNDLFARAHVLVMPYLSASQSGIVRIAFANHLPIIASRVGGLPEAITDRVNGLLVPPGDSNALADAIISYFTENLGSLFVSHFSSSAEDLSLHPLTAIVEEFAR